MDSQNLGNFFKNKKILITGHTGFKGSWLAETLVNFGARVSGISLEPSTKPSLFTILRLEKEVNHYIADIRDETRLKKIIQKEAPEIIFHLAAQPLVRESYDNPITTFQTNVIGTANVLEAVRESPNTRAVVLITTDKVYSNKEWIWAYREIDALGGYDPYSSSKACAELVIDSYIKSFFNPDSDDSTPSALIASARAGNVIGGGDWQKDRLMTDIIRSIFEKDGKIVIRNPEAVRPWQFVLEPLYGYMLLAQKLFEGKKEFTGAWNFGPEDTNFLSVKSLIQKTLQTAGKGSYKIQQDPKKHESQLLKLDIQKAKSLLKWEPVWNIDTTLSLTVRWYEDYYSGKDVISTTDDQIDLFFSAVKLMKIRYT